MPDSKITVDTLKVGSFQYGKDVSFENDVEVTFSYNSAGRAVMQITDENGYSKKIRVTTKKPLDTPDALSLNSEELPTGKGANEKIGYIQVVFPQD